MITLFTMRERKLADEQATARNELARDVVKLYARGNVRLQLGMFVTATELEHQRKEALAYTF